MKKISVYILIMFIVISLFTVSKSVFATDTWYFTKTNNLMLETNQPGAVEFFNFDSENGCVLELKKVKNDSSFILFSECSSVSDIENNQAWSYSIQTTTPQIINNNPIGFKTEQDCNINRDNFLRSLVYSENKDNYKNIGKCVKKSNTSNNGVVAVTPLDAKIDLTAVSDTYIPLAPIGDNKEIKANNVGDYINTIIKLAIGLCGALAVIMIILGGIQYMGDESVFGKTEAKSKIFSAILGLLIALGAYALLNTINPDLTGKKGVIIDSADLIIDRELEPMTMNDAFTEGMKTAKCPEGIFNVSTINGTLPLCKSIQESVRNLIKDAGSAGYRIFGYSYRSTARQTELRKQNCGGDTTNAKAKCDPSTALPGKSNHESALAIDFTCDGQSIKSEDNKCFIWLRNNVSKYNPSLKNLSGEPWHWSTDGR